MTNITGWFLNLLDRNGRHRIITDRAGKLPYMHRYYLLFKDKMLEFEDGKPLPFNVMLHNIVQSDEDDFHDHPWWYFTLVLSGGYWENTPIGRFWRGPGHFRISRPTSLHKLELPYAGANAWTFFIKGPKVRDWGFINQSGKWEYWKTYLQKRYGM